MLSRQRRQAEKAPRLVCSTYIGVYFLMINFSQLRCMSTDKVNTKREKHVLHAM